ncbi:MAG TPA: AMP-binding protein, partial [Sphingopyxis sp.]|nr:AMP-binding protein [Sphingopyxis sp.]
MTKTPTISAAMIHPFSGRDVPWLLRTRAETTPDDPFLVWESFAGEDRAWNCAAFAAAVEDCAANLAAQDIGPGDRVMIHLDNCPEFLFLWFACARIGAIAVTTNTRCPADEIAYFATHSRAALAVT